MADKKRNLVRCIVLLIIASLSQAVFASDVPPLSDASQVKLTKKLAARIPKPWTLVPQTLDGLVVLSLPKTPASRTPEVARVSVTIEERAGHSSALQRLREIAGEQSGDMRYLEICGWPALERVSKVELPHRVQEHSEPDERVVTNVVTVAIAADDELVRYEGTLAPKESAEQAKLIVDLAGKLKCSARPKSGATARDIDELKKLQKLEPAPSGEPAKPPVLAPKNQLEEKDEVPREKRPPIAATLNASEVEQLTGELQVAVSSDGRDIVVALQFGQYAFSNDFGATFTPVRSLSIGATDGDPTTAFGPSGAFYYAGLSFPPGSSPADSCFIPVAKSTDHGASFNRVGEAAFCSSRDPLPCGQDQEQMASDRKNRIAGRDQLYMVWRHFLPVPGTAPISCFNGVGGVSPAISCSKDGGVTWKIRRNVGTGDRGRPGVGPDGSVYVTYVAGTSLMINKFSSCALGLRPQPHFPVNLGTITELCPVPGLTWCGGFDQNSPQPAVDDRDASKVFVAYADHTAPDNENVVVRFSQDGGLHWSNRVVVNGGGSARRFSPWICASDGIPWVSWYDRRAGAMNPAQPDLTAYYVNYITLQTNAFTHVTTALPGVERNASGVNDPQCLAGWPHGANPSDVTGCPAGTSPLTGLCEDSQGNWDGQDHCNPAAPSCPSGLTCVERSVAPKFGDYNGNACTRGAVYVSWASATPPADVTSASPGINIYSDKLNYAHCGTPGGACCFQAGAQCALGTIQCDSSETCRACGHGGQACCAGLHCSFGFTCSGNVCECGGLNQACCAPTGSCKNNLVCTHQNFCEKQP